MIIGIVAIAENFAIGKNGKLPWHYSADLRHFKETTVGNVVVMGSGTWRSIGRPLPDRWNFILSRSDIPDLPEICVPVHKKEEVLSVTAAFKRDFYIIGGAATFETFRDDIQRWIVTRVPETIDDADVFMPRDFLDGFVLKKRKEIGDGLIVDTFDRRV